jgi:tetratricopeptide (TPR) repeat protein
LECLASAERLAEEQRFGFIVEPKIVRGAALIQQGALEEAAAQLRDGLITPSAIRLRCHGFAKLAEALVGQGQHAAALAAVRNGLTLEQETGHHQWAAELERMRGLALSCLNEGEEAQSALQNALRIARRQDALGYELRAATYLARLWGERGRRAEARALLAPVHGRFSEGFDTADVKAAEALLAELA